MHRAQTDSIINITISGGFKGEGKWGQLSPFTKEGQLDVPFFGEKCARRRDPKTLLFNHFDHVGQTCKS